MIVYGDSIAGIKAESLAGFFEGWPDPPSRETHLKLLAGSDHCVLAVDEQSGKVIGFVTAISDGVLSAYIPLLEVLPAWRGRGIGSELMRRMLAKLDGLYMVDVICDPEMQRFYARFGMRRSLGMVRRDPARQAGGLGAP